MKSFYTLLLSVFFIGVFLYLINFALIPYKDDDTLDMQSYVIVSISFILVITSLITFIHVSIDKLFFRKFYEEPNLLVAIRRGFLLGFLFAGYFWLRVFDSWMWHIVLFYTALIILIEAFIMTVYIGFSHNESKKKGKKQSKE